MSEQNWTAVVDGSKRNSFDFKEIINSKDLILLWVKRNFVSKYKQTILGPAWAIIQPFFTTVVYSVFFGNIAGLGAQNVPNFIFYFCGTIIWNVFSGCLTNNANTFISNKHIFSKVYFPRLVMPISSAISQFINFAIQFLFMLCFWAYYLITDAGLAPNIYILMVPVVLVQLSVLGMSCGVIISSLTTKYKDLQMVVGFGVSLWSYCSPVAYDMFSRNALMPGSKFYALYMLNPVTSGINIFRYAFLGTGEIDWLFYGISWIFTIVVAVIAVRVFSRVERTFLDTI